MRLSKGQFYFAMTMLGCLFFIFGFVTWLNGTLIPFFKLACQISTFQALWVTFAFYISYFIMAFPSALVLKKTGYKNGISLGLAIMALGSIIFIPAAYERMYLLFLTGLFVQGTGLALLQTAVNPYVTILGPEHSAAKRISVMGICNKIAGILSPIILGSIILKNIDQIIKQLENVTNDKNVILDQLSERLIFPYITMAIILTLLAFATKFIKLPDIKAAESPFKTKKSIFHFPYLILGVIAMFLYVGAEVIAGDTIILYGQSLGIPLSKAKFFTSLTLSSMILGYILGIMVIPRIISQSRALAYSAISGIAFAIAAILTQGLVSITFIALLGFSNAIMWPAIWPLSIKHLGSYTEKGAAFLIMAILGGAILPPLYGWLSQLPNLNNKQAYIILLPMYAYILFFAVKGHKITSWKKNQCCPVTSNIVD
ncbi:MAG TPA: sugar MFS transporter [Bacteroidales bacterium]|nr:sugar MFS transporter [Bacteroidales bacterium]